MATKDENMIKFQDVLDRYIYLGEYYSCYSALKLFKYIELGVDPNTRVTAKGETIDALYLIIVHNHIEALQRLLEYDINITRVLDGKTALNTLLDFRHLDIFEGYTKEEMKREKRNRLKMIILLLQYAIKKLDRSELENFVNKGPSPLKKISNLKLSGIPDSFRNEIIRLLLESGAK